MAEQKSHAISFDIVVEGADSGASEVTRLNRAFDATARSTGTAIGGLSRVSGVVTEGGRKWGELAGAVGNVGAVFAQVSPVMGQAGSVIGAVGSASTALTGALGPLGVGFAAVTTALGFIIPLLQSTSSEMRETASAADEAAESTRDLIEALRREQRQRNIATSNASETALQAEADALQTQIDERLAQEERWQRGIDQIREQAANLERERQRSMSTGRLLSIREEQQAHETALEQLEAVRSQSEATRAELATQRDTLVMRGLQMSAEGAFDEDPPERRRRSGASEAERARREAEEEARQQRLRAKEAENSAILAMEREQEEAQQLRVNAMIENEERLALERARIRAEDQEAMQQQLQDEIALVQRREQEMQASYERITNESLPIIQEAIGGITEALSATIAGAKSADQAFQGLLAGFLELIAQQTALQAAKEFAEAIAAFASQRYDQGALHLAAGAAFTAVAVAAGAASIAVAPPAEAAPASPQAGGSGGSGGGGNSYTFNVNGPVLTAGSRANLGRELSSVLSDGERRFGRAA